MYIRACVHVYIPAYMHLCCCAAGVNSEIVSEMKMLWGNCTPSSPVVQRLASRDKRCTSESGGFNWKHTDTNMTPQSCFSVTFSLVLLLDHGNELPGNHLLSSLHSFWFLNYLHISVSIYKAGWLHVFWMNVDPKLHLTLGSPSGSFWWHQYTCLLHLLQANAHIRKSTNTWVTNSRGVHRFWRSNSFLVLVFLFNLIILCLRVVSSSSRTGQLLYTLPGDSWNSRRVAQDLVCFCRRLILFQ